MDKLRALSAGIVAAGALLASSQGAYAATYYVAVSGSDSAAGTSASPFRSLQRGVDAASPGDTIIVRDGTYPGGGSMGVNINKAGGPSAWITLKAERRWGAILDCMMACHSYINFQGASAYWVIQDFDIRNGVNGGIWSNSGGARNILIQGNKIHHIGNAPNTTQYGVVGIYTDTGAQNFKVDRNVIHDVGRTNTYNSLDHGIYAHGHLIITNNVFYNVRSGWHIQTSAGFSGSIINNTFFGPNPYPGKVGQIMLWDPNSNLIIRNNVFYNPKSVGITTAGPTISGVCSFDNNIVFSAAGGVSLIDALPAGCVQASNRLNVDPQLVNPASLDMHLRPGSPAINQGVASSIVPLDHDGVARPQGAGYDIGAFEYAGVSSPPGDATPPAISAAAASAVGQNGATIGWTTNEAADTQVEYGPTAAYGASTSLNPALTTSHSTVLGGLTAGTLYHYRVKSKDAAGNLAVSGDFTFTTSAAAPGCLTAAAAWKNAAFPPQTGVFSVEFDAIPAAANLDALSGLSRSAAVDYTSLAAIVRFNNAGYIDARNGGAYAAAGLIPYVAGLTYHVRLAVNVAARTYSAYVKQGANAEQLIGGNYAFRSEQAGAASLDNLGAFASAGGLSVCAAVVSALPPPDSLPPAISAVAVSAAGQSGATIGWTTNEAADTQVEYGPTAAYGASTSLNPALATSHSAVLGGLTAGTLHHYRVKSKDAAGNLAVSGDFTFTTSASAPGCLTAAAAWKNAPLPPQTGVFTVEFDAIPAAANLDALSGLSRSAAVDYTSLAAIVRFNNSGYIDARSGGAYAAAALIPYAAGLTHRVRITVNVPARTYSAYVKQGANAERLIGGNYAFRSEQAGAASLDNLGVFASAGSLAVCGAAVSASGPPPDSLPPAISAVAASAVGQNGATIGWTTNEAADTQVEYGPTAAYGASTSLNPALATSHSAVLGGLTAGTLHHYRVKSKDAAGNLAVAGGFTFTTGAAPPPAACLTAAGAWRNAPLPPQTGVFTVEYDAVPASANLDGLTGLSRSAAVDYTSLAAIVRFNNAGNIDARNGGAYAAAALIPYAAGLTHRVRITVNVPARTYSAYVKQGAGAERLIGGNYAFRSEQAGTASLDSFGVFTSAGSLTVCGAAVK